MAYCVECGKKIGFFTKHHDLPNGGILCLHCYENDKQKQKKYGEYKKEEKKILEKQAKYKLRLEKEEEEIKLRVGDRINHIKEENKKRKEKKSFQEPINEIEQESPVIQQKEGHERETEEVTIDEYNWKDEIYDIVNHIEEDEFTLKDVFGFEDKLKSKFPDNHNIKAKIRQQLQILRDEGIIDFIETGKYKKIDQKEEEKKIVEFEHIISGAEYNFGYLSLKDEGGKSYGNFFPPDRTKVTIIDNKGHEFSSIRRGKYQLYRNIILFFKKNQVMPGDKISIKYNPNEKAGDGSFIIRVETKQIETPQFEEKREETIDEFEKKKETIELKLTDKVRKYDQYSIFVTNQKRRINLTIFNVRHPDSAIQNMIDEMVQRLEQKNVEKEKFEEEKLHEPIDKFEEGEKEEYDEQGRRVFRLNDTDEIVQCGDDSIYVKSTEQTINCRENKVYHPDPEYQKLIDDLEAGITYSIEKGTDTDSDTDDHTSEDEVEDVEETSKPTTDDMDREIIRLNPDDEVMIKDKNCIYIINKGRTYNLKNFKLQHPNELMQGLINEHEESIGININNEDEADEIEDIDVDQKTTRISTPQSTDEPEWKAKARELLDKVKSKNINSKNNIKESTSKLGDDIPILDGSTPITAHDFKKKKSRKWGKDN